ncbi:MAG: hypothetical protein IKP22_02920 [Clostridia bacterium]|nr:hypothetical protein [Clostridia bacterium]
MTKNKRLLLKAVEHNWSLTGPGSWNEIKWLIFYDGYFQVVSVFTPTFEVINKRETQKCTEQRTPVMKKTAGRMPDEAFAKLREAIKCEPWRDPALHVSACDGAAWEIESYGEDGSIESTSGKLDYIYGHRVLEKIVSLLPGDKKTIFRFPSSSFS